MKRSREIGRQVSLQPWGAFRERGNTLLIVVVLLLLATLFVMFALTVGRFEQRTSGNDLRSKIVQEVAESGLALGVEFLNADRSVFADDDNWRACAADEDEFPCGAVPAARRATMYTYRTTGTTGSTLAQRLLPIDTAIADSSAGGFAASRNVGAVLCRVAPLAPPAAAACTTDIAAASNTWVLTVVSKGELTDEGSSSTVTQTIGAYNIFNFGPGTPPLVASGSVGVGGGFQIATSGGTGGDVDSGPAVSVWSRLSVGANGTPNTCMWGSFQRQGGTNAGPPTYYDGIEICHTCSCPSPKPTGDLGSYGSGTNLCEDADIVDIEGSGSGYDLTSYNAYDVNHSTCLPNKANLSIRRESFPADLFEFIFGQVAWQDDATADTLPCARDDFGCHFSEVRVIEPQCQYPDAATGSVLTASLPADTCYLLNIKNKIHIGDGVNDAAECQALGSTTSGVVWVHNTDNPLGTTGMNGYNCDTTLKGLAQLGTPSKPVALIYDGVITQMHLKMYGLIFVREPNDNTTLSATTGGSAELGLNGGAVVYGAAIVQGAVSSGGGGTASIIYNKNVLFNLINNPDNLNPASMPGSWTDRLRY